MDNEKDMSVNLDRHNWQSESETMPLLASLASGMALQNSIEDQNKDEIQMRFREVEDLVLRLEDVASMLREQIYKAKEATQFARPEKVDKLPFFVRYQLLMVFIFQVIIVACIVTLDSGGPDIDKTYVTLTDALIVMLQIFTTIVVGFSTAILSRKLFQNGAKPLFLAQTYLSTVLVFAGLYFIIFRFKPLSWEVSSVDDINTSPAFIQYIRLVYLSVSAATLCGASNIQPRQWYTIILVCFQSLINFVYFASILAQTIGNYNSYTINVKRSRGQSIRRSYRSYSYDDSNPMT